MRALALQLLPQASAEVAPDSAALPKAQEARVLVTITCVILAVLAALILLTFARRWGRLARSAVNRRSKPGGVAPSPWSVAGQRAAPAADEPPETSDPNQETR